MVHVFCPYENCRRIIHLDNQYYWNCENTYTCPQCNGKIRLCIKGGEIKFSVPIR